jgi:hypothetical protein
MEMMAPDPSEPVGHATVGAGVAVGVGVVVPDTVEVGVGVADGLQVNTPERDSTSHVFRRV